MTRANTLREKLADVVTTWIAMKQGRGLTRMSAKDQHGAALAVLAISLLELDEPLAGILWSRAYDVIILWAKGLSMERAMRKLVYTYAKIAVQDAVR
jgi:hypothetical protein